MENARPILEADASEVPDGHLYSATVVDTALADALLDGRQWSRVVLVVDRALGRITAASESHPPMELRLRRARGARVVGPRPQ